MTGDDERPWARITLVVGDLELPVGSVERTSPCDMALVDDLLGLRLAAKRLGLPIRITDVHEDLRDLFYLLGVTELIDA